MRAFDETQHTTTSTTMAQAQTQATAYKRHVLAVDSHSRESFDFSTAAKYKIVFPPIRNVKMIRLVSSEIPNTEYVVNARNNLLYLWDGLGVEFDVLTNLPDHDVVVALSQGTYTANEIANEINKQLNIALGAVFGQKFQVTAMTMTSKIRIDRVDGVDFRLHFNGKSSSAALVLGFDPNGNSVTQTEPVTLNKYTQSDTVMNLAGENFVYLCIKGLPTVTTTERTNDVFAKIIYNTPPRSIAFDSFQSNAFIYPEPQGVLSELQVSFVRRDGYLVDFNNIEHSFTLEFFTV